jgi:hypothetical protein
VRLLLERGADNIDDTLPFACNAHNIAVVKLLLEKGANPDARHPYGETGLMIASSGFGDIDIVQLLLESGADPWATDRQGRTASDLARAEGLEHIVRVLDAAEHVSTMLRAKTIKSESDMARYLMTGGGGGVSKPSHLARHLRETRGVDPAGLPWVSIGQADNAHDAATPETAVVAHVVNGGLVKDQLPQLLSLLEKRTAYIESEVTRLTS